MIKVAELPAGGVWQLRPATLHNNVFLIATNPQHEPRAVGRTAQGEVFVRVLTVNEKAATGS